jgi:hypothetical protein
MTARPITSSRCSAHLPGTLGVEVEVAAAKLREVALIELLRRHHHIAQIDEPYGRSQLYLDTAAVLLEHADEKREDLTEDRLA